MATTQVSFLEKYLRGTGKTLSEAQAAATFGVLNLRARLTEMRQAGLTVRKTTNTAGKTAYAVSRRDIVGGQAKLYS